MELTEPLERERGPSGLWRSITSWSSRLEWWTLGVTALALSAVWGFVELADEVVEGSARRFDRRLLLALRAEGSLEDPLGPWWLEQMVRDLSSLGGLSVMLGATALVTGFLILAGKRRSALYLDAVVAGGIVMSLALKDFFARPRPDLVPHATHVVTASFPSGHSMMAALVWLTLAAMVARVLGSVPLKAYVLGAALVITAFVGLSRVYLGVHWPTDVLAGWAAGAAWALGFWTGARILQRRGRLE